MANRPHIENLQHSSVNYKLDMYPLAACGSFWKTDVAEMSKRFARAFSHMQSFVNQMEIDRNIF